MVNKETPRLSRLTAILTRLQEKRLVTSKSLVESYCVSVRTIYRDIKALEQAGIPVLIEKGKDYTLMEGYRIPPIMFTEEEASTLITAERLLFVHQRVEEIDFTNPNEITKRDSTPEAVEGIAIFKHLYKNHYYIKRTFLERTFKVEYGTDISTNSSVFYK